MKRWIAALLSTVLLLSVSGAALAADPDTVEISSAEDLAGAFRAVHVGRMVGREDDRAHARHQSHRLRFFPHPAKLSERLTAAATAYSAYPFDGDASTQGLFRIVLKTGVVKKSHGLGTLRATGNGENIGGIAGVNYGAIENCRFDGDILAQAAAGGIVGR